MKRYGKIGNSIEDLMKDARTVFSGGVLCSILRAEDRLGNVSYAWHYPADFVPNPDHVKKIGEFVA